MFCHFVLFLSRRRIVRQLQCFFTMADKMRKPANIRDKFDTVGSLIKIKDKEKHSLHKILDEAAIVKAHERFMGHGGKVDRTRLQKILEDIADLHYTEQNFETLFLRMNINRDGLVTWDEFISHLILGFKDEEVSCEYEALDPPLAKAPRMLRSRHRHPINRVLFCPTVKPDRSANFTDGSYMTCSKDGCINYWSLDFQHERTCQSSCPELKVQQTWVTDMVALPDVSVVCTSSTERDLRFYDTSARKFELRVMMTSLDDAVCALNYIYHQDINEESFMLMGDMGGNIKILYFSSIGRGPFKSKPGIPLLSTRFDRVMKGLVPGFRVVELRRVHEDSIRQIQFYHSLRSILSVAACSKVSMSIKDEGGKTNYTYKVPKGFWSFAIEESQHLIATGGPDCIVRLWNPFVTSRPNTTFLGHHSGIVGLIFQEGGKKLCSISKDKCLKVWDTVTQTCLQTYVSIPPELGERTALTVFYNPENRNMILASVMIGILSLCPLQSGEHTDGNTHSSAVSRVLYNPLFKVIVTCGLDSLIIVWDPYAGRRISVVRDAHVRLLRGEEIPVEITAACFDPGNHLLLTGAHDGSLKMWNFNTGTCLRNMNIEHNNEITSVVWVKGRILAIGWNKHVTEFLESGEAIGPGGAFSKSWDTRHTEDVLSAVARVPQTLATGSYSGELLFWKLETGQPYKQYNVAQPTVQIKIKYAKQSKKKLAQEQKALTDPVGEVKPGAAVGGKGRSGSIFNKQRTQSVSSGGGGEQALQNVDKARARRLSVVQVPAELVPPKGLAVRCMLFLSARPMQPGVGTLLISVETGYIQVWSHHTQGGYITRFSAVHMAGDYVMSMTSDPENEYLFTGTTGGYIKTWLMKDFCVKEEYRIFMPIYRIQFPFLWKDRIEGRAKRTHRGQTLPTLLNSYKGHRMLVTGLVYVPANKMVISSSADFTCRLWTLGGQYLGTLGTFKPWKKMPPDEPVGPDFQFEMPPDIRRIASSTTFKVLMGGIYDRPLTRKQKERLKERELTEKDYSKGVYGVKVREPILGHYFKLPERETHVHDFTLDTSFSYIPVYQHLITPVPQEAGIPKNPDDIKIGPDQRKAKELLNPNYAQMM